MDKNLHSKKGAPEQLQLKSCSPPTTTQSTLAVSEQPGNSQTTTTAQTLSKQPGYLSQTENISQTISEQPGYSRNAANTVQTVSKLPGCSSHASEPEQFYHDIAEEYSTGTPSVAAGNTVQLPHLANTYKPR